MSQDATGHPRHSRPRVTGSFVEANDPGIPVLIAIGRAVAAAAGLEMNLRLEATRLLLVTGAGDTDGDGGLREELARLEELTAGQLLKRMRDLDLPEDLDKRIASAIERRNALVHHTFDDPDVAKAVGGSGDMTEVVNRINRLALDCGELAVELQLFALPRIEAVIGIPIANLATHVMSIDTREITDPRERRQLEAIQAFGDPQRLAGARDVVVSDAQPTPTEPGSEPLCG